MTDEKELKLWDRLWIYQKERFPLAAHAPLIFAFSFCAVSISARLRIAQWPNWQSVVVAFISCLLFFLQLRIADEFKDAKDDAMYRPYRAVPRGLVKLSWLGIIFILAALIQFALGYLWHRYLVFILIIVWVYLAGMSFEFGVKDWLKARPVTYLWTHMLIMPLIDLYATATDWAVIDHPFVPNGLIFFLGASFFNGVVIETGRKIRMPAQEEHGVETYSKLWGYKKAAAVWWLMIALTAVFGCLTAYRALALAQVAAVLWTCAALLAIFVLIFTLFPSQRQAKWFEAASGLWTLCLYLSLGILPGVFAHA